MKKYSFRVGVDLPEYSIRTIQLDTNFLIEEPLELIISNVHGVERVDTLGKYSASIHIGNLFDMNEVIDSIKESVINYVED